MRYIISERQLKFIREQKPGGKLQSGLDNLKNVLKKIEKKRKISQKYNPNLRPAIDNTRTNITRRNLEVEKKILEKIWKEKKELEDCEKLWSPLLPKAVDYWKKWLTHNVTKQKIAQKNFNGDMKSASEVIDEYLKLLSNFRLVVYYDETSENFARVNSNNSKNIYINCAHRKDEVEMIATLIHEIQHQLYNYQPINPAASISNVFNTNFDFKKYFMDPSKLQSVGPNLKNVYGTIEKSKQLAPQTATQSAIQKIATTLNINVNDPLYDRLVFYITNLETERKDGYTCRETENMSRIMAMRQLFGINDPTKKITVDMLKPYFTYQKRNEDVWWFLSCWAKNGFGDLQEILNRTNDLALRKNKNQNQALV